jgi:hypothetical protein
MTNKPLGDFIVDARYHMGVTGWCRDCKNARSRKRAAEVKDLPKPPIPEKCCTMCGKTKPVSEFSRMPSKRDGFASRCKACRCVAEARQRMTSYTPKRNHLWQQYGMRPEDLAAMIASQGGGCAICTETLIRPAVDHCHVTGKIRGALCHRCNIHLRTLEDDLFVERATDYLREHRLKAGVFFIKPHVQKARERRRTRNRAARAA